jgi:hypothetical protein
MKRLHAVLLACALLLAPAAAAAATVVADFDGYIYYVTDPATGVALNDPVHGRVRYESDAPPEPDSSQQAVYRNLDELSINILHEGAPMYAFSASGGMTVVVSSPSAYSFLVYGREGLEDDTLLGQPLEGLSLILQNDQAVPGTSTALPLELSLAPFNPALSFFDVDVNDNTVLSAYITTIRVVPEPSSLVLVSLAMAALLAFHRRIKSATR